MMGTPRRNPKVVRQILALTLQGIEQREIARRLNIHRNRVFRWQRSVGLSKPYRGPRVPELTEAQRAEALVLLQAGRGTGRVAVELGVSEHRVRELRAAHSIHRAPSIPTEKRQQIEHEIRNRRDFATYIAQRHGVSYKAVLKLAHEIFACQKFIASRCGPFQSRFPMREREAYRAR